MCDCGAEGTTREVWIKRSLITNGRPLVAYGVLEKGEKEDPDLKLNPDSVVTPERARVGRRGRKNTRDYTPEFEQLWEGCKGKRGNKYPAFNAWLKFKPDVAFVIKRWSQWMQTGQFQYGAVPHLSSWLRAKGWETEPTQEDLRPWRNGRGRETPEQERKRVEAERAAAERDRIRRAESHAQALLTGLGDAKS